MPTANYLNTEPVFFKYKVSKTHNYPCYFEFWFFFGDLLKVIDVQSDLTIFNFYDILNVFFYYKGYCLRVII